jgi:phosphatidylglycerophosphate synthase
MKLPSTAELRAVCQPDLVLGRRNAEHWAGLLYMRRLSIHATKVFLRLGWSPNAITGGMIVTGLLGAACLLIPGIWGAVACALLIQLYLLLDCSDGEVARWTKRTSVTGVYLDRLGHYVVEAALLVALGLRAASNEPTGYALIGALAALCAILVKSETDLVAAARYGAQLPLPDEDAATPTSATLRGARRFASMLKIHRITGAIEASLLILAAAVVDGLRDDLVATQALLVALAIVASAMVLLHLVSILGSRRLA